MKQPRAFTKILLSMVLTLALLPVAGFALPASTTTALPEQLPGVQLTLNEVVPLSNAQVRISYTVTNNTGAVLSKSNVVGLYSRSVTKSNFILAKTLKSDVAPGQSITMTDTASKAGIGSVPLVLRLFDDGKTYPKVTPKTFSLGDLSGHEAAQIVNPEKTVSLANLQVKRTSASAVTVSYTVTNNASSAVAKGSFIAFYKNSPENGNFMLYRTLPKSVPVGASVTMTDSFSKTNIAMYPLAAQLFDKGTGVFPYVYPSPFPDVVTENKIQYELIDNEASVAMTDFSVKKVNADRVTLSYRITNNTNGKVSKSSLIAFYEDQIGKPNLLFTKTVGKDVAAGSSLLISQNVSSTGIANKRIVARLFDNGSSFPYTAPSGLIDTKTENKTVSGASFHTKVICIGDSVTEGVLVSSYTYPYYLQKKLGDGYAVVNYGVSGHTASSGGDRPYVKTAQYQKALASAPDVVIIMLGSNDSKALNWTPGNQAAFKSDYTALVQSFIDLPNAPEVILATPIGVYKDKNQYGIRESVLATEIRPQVRTIGSELGLNVIENATLLSASSSYYVSDGVHPSAKGYDVLSSNIQRYVLHLQ